MCALINITPTRDKSVVFLDPEWSLSAAMVVLVLVLVLLTMDPERVCATVVTAGGRCRNYCMDLAAYDGRFKCVRILTTAR